MNQLKFVKGKWLITKSVDDLVVWGYFECSKELYYKLMDNINKVMTMKITLDNNSIELNCSINTDTKSYLQFIEDHWLVKLDIIVPDILLSGYIIKWDINLFINKK